MNLADRIRDRALATGFDLAGIAPAGPAAHPGALQDWLDAGFAGGMAWLGRDPARREDLAKVLPGARSAVVVGRSYFVEEPPPEIWNDPSRGRIARYAWGPDYHGEMLPRLEELAAFIGAEAGTAVHFRTYVDTGPVLERDLAARAELGFIGKNTNLINPRFGSYLFIGEILLDIELEGPAPSGPGRSGRDGARPSTRLACGRCNRCLTACPTQAFPEPYVLDARRCISCLTIENAGAIREDLRRSMGNWIFGCDECQQVCPWNAASAARRGLHPGYNAGAACSPDVSPGGGSVRARRMASGSRFLRWDPERCAPPLVEVMALDEKGFHERFEGTPVMRAKRRGLLRNAAVALGNWGDPAALPALEKASGDADPLVREHAAWAVGQIRRKSG